MPRTKRLDIAGVAQHVVQRGNDRQPCFFREEDYQCYLTSLREACLKFACQVHAYVLMTNHVHLLLTPNDAGAVGKVMQAVGRRYVRYVNDASGRTGTLWEGRFKASLIDSERYLLACYRYIELNPVRAGMVLSPAGHGWSSYRANALGGSDRLVSPHATYLTLDSDHLQRLTKYRDLVQQAICDEDLAALRLYIQRQRALGSERFLLQIEQHLQRRAGIGKPAAQAAVKWTLTPIFRFGRRADANAA